MKTIFRIFESRLELESLGLFNLKNKLAHLCVLLFVWTIGIGMFPVGGFAAALPITLTTQVVNESCPGTADGIITVTPSGGIGNYSFLWSTGDQVAQLTGLTAGTYSVTVTDSQGNTASTSATVGVNGPAPLAQTGRDTLICGISFQLNGITDPGTSGLWENLNSAGIVANPSSASTLVSGMQPGENTFVWIVTNGQCTNTDTITIRVSATTQIFAGPDTLLCGTSIDLRGSGIGTGTGLWTSNPAVNFQNPNQPTTTVSGMVAGTVYTLVWTVTEGPCTASDSMLIEVLEVPTANFTFNGSGLSVNFTDNSSLASAWNWSFGDGTSASIANPSHTYAQGGNYTVCLYASNACGEDTLCRELTIIPLATTAPSTSDLSLSPLPAREHVHVSLRNWPDTEVSISLYTLEGKSLQNRHSSLSQGGLEGDLPLSGLVPGIYLLRVESDGKQTHRRFIIAR